MDRSHESPHPDRSLRRAAPRDSAWCVVPGLLLLAALLQLTVKTAVLAAEPFKRIASVNLCLDEIVQRIAAPRQLVAVSSVAHDPSLSTIAAEVGSLPGLDLRGERVLALRPDVLLVHDYGGAAVKAILRQQGVTVVELPMALDLESAAQQAIAIGKAIGRPSQGGALAEAMQQTTARLTSVQEHYKQWPLAAFWQPNGGTEGRGTLADDLLNRAGFRNLATELGISGFGVIPIETLILHQPSVLVVDGTARTSRSLAEMLQVHPALRAAGVDSAIVDVPRRTTVCAGPQSLQALALLVQARQVLRK